VVVELGVVVVVLEGAVVVGVGAVVLLDGVVVVVELVTPEMRVCMVAIESRVGFATPVPSGSNATVINCPLASLMLEGSVTVTGWLEPAPVALDQTWMNTSAVL